MVQYGFSNVDAFLWKFLMEVMIKENVILDSLTVIDFETPAVVSDSSLTSMFCTRFCMLLCSLWIVAEMCRTFAIEFARRVAVDSSRKASFQDYGIGV
jgi:hypothetical protein